jgi:hypothetical protein
MTDFRALCAELLDWAERTSSHYYKQSDVILRARAALAVPAPASPTDEELLELLSRVSGLPDNDTYIVDGGRIMSEPNELLAFARAVLARYGTANNTINQED